MNTNNKLIGSLAISLLAQLASPVQAMTGDSKRIEVQHATNQCHSALRHFTTIRNSIAYTNDQPLR